MLLLNAEFVRSCELGNRGLFELVSGDASSLTADSGEECESEGDSASFPGTTGDDDGGFQAPLHFEIAGNPACLLACRLSFAATSAAVESSEHRLLSRTSIPLFILHGTFRGALPA